MDKLIIKEKLDYYLANSIHVHLAKLNNSFINGKLLRKVSEDIYIILDDLTGERIDVFVNEIFDVTNWVETK